MRKKWLHLIVARVGLGISLLTLAARGAMADEVDDAEKKFLQAHPGYHGFLTPLPPYPAQARLARVQGALRAQVTYSAKGNVESVVVVQSSGSSILDLNVNAFVKRYWRSLKGRKIVFTTEFDFKLRRVIRPAGTAAVRVY